MDRINIQCGNDGCIINIGKFDDLFDCIDSTGPLDKTGSLYLPLRARPYNLGGLKLTGMIQVGKPKSILALCEMQNLACKGCGGILGARCQDAPEGHIIKNGQLLLQLSKMKITSERTGKMLKVDLLNVQNRYAMLQEEKMDKTPSKLDDKRISQDLLLFSVWTENAITRQQSSIDHIFGAVGRLEQDMILIKDFMSSVQQELKAKSSSAETFRLTEKIATLQQSVKDFSVPSGSGISVGGKPLGVSLDERDIFTDSIISLGHKVDQVDTLKRELELVRARVKYLEKVTNSISNQSLKLQSTELGDQPSNGVVVEKGHDSIAGGSTFERVPNFSSKRRIHFDKNAQVPKRSKLSSQHKAVPPKSPTGSIVEDSEEIDSIDELQASDTEISQVIAPGAVPSDNGNLVEMSNHPSTRTSSKRQIIRRHSLSQNDQALPPVKPVTQRQTRRTTLPSQQSISIAAEPESIPEDEPAPITPRKRRKSRKHTMFSPYRKANTRRVTKQAVPEKRMERIKQLAAHHENKTGEGADEDQMEDDDNMDTVGLVVTRERTVADALDVEREMKRKEIVAAREKIAAEMIEKQMRGYD